MNNLHETGKKIRALPNFAGTVDRDKALAPLTSFKIGGSAALFIEAHDESSLLAALRVLRQEDTAFFVLGGGSNLVVSDSGFQCAVLSMRHINTVQTSAECLRIGAGARWGAVLRKCRSECVSGLEAFAGLPGTVGGAAYMNASCFGRSMSDVLVSARYIDTDSLSLQEYTMDKADWSYKKSPFAQRHRIITQVVLAGAQQERTEESAEHIRAECARNIMARKEKGHFRFPCAGSVFRNNAAHGAPAGKLIDEAGLRGLRSGGAQIAPWHGNIIINTGGATARDVQALVAAAKSAVQEKYGFILEEEVIFCGN